MIFGGEDDDEPISAALEIPDLQASDMQKLGPYYLAHDEKRINLNYYQDKNKYEIYFRIMFYLKKIRMVSIKCRRIGQSKALQLWKIYKKNESVVRDWKLIKKFTHAVRIAQSYAKYLVIKRFYRWRNAMEIGKAREKEIKLGDDLCYECENVKQRIGDINSEIQSYEEAIGCFKENEKNYNRKINTMRENQDQQKSHIKQNYKLFRSLQRENENIREKIEMLEETYNEYQLTMNSLLLS